MLVNITSAIPCSTDKLFEKLRTPGSLEHVAHPLITFTSIEKAPLQYPIAVGTHRYTTTLFGLIPMGVHTMVFSYPHANNKLVMRDNGYSGLCRRWDHHMTITSEKNGCRYNDHAEIEAGIATPFVWLFAQVFYRHRQRRWRKWAKTNFSLV